MADDDDELPISIDDMELWDIKRNEPSIFYTTRQLEAMTILFPRMFDCEIHLTPNGFKELCLDNINGCIDEEDGNVSIWRHGLQSMREFLEAWRASLDASFARLEELEKVEDGAPPEQVAIPVEQQLLDAWNNLTQDQQQAVLKHPERIVEKDLPGEESARQMRIAWRAANSLQRANFLAAISSDEDKEAE